MKTLFLLSLSFIYLTLLNYFSYCKKQLLYINNNEFSPGDWLSKFFSELNRTLLSSYEPFLNKELYNSSETQKCLSTLLSLAKEIENNPKINNALYDYFEFSGKCFPDIGFEQECINLENAVYFFLLASYNMDEVSPEKMGNKTSLFPFLAYKYSYYGLCIHSECQKAISNYLSVEKDENFLRELYNNYHFNLSYYTSTKEVGPNSIWDLKNENGYYVFYTVVIIFLIYFTLRVIINFIGFLYFEHNSQNDKKPNEGNFKKLCEEDLEESDEESEEDEDEDNSDFEDIGDTDEKKKIKKTKKNKNTLILKELAIPSAKVEKTRAELHPHLFFLYQLNSFFYGLKILITKKNDYYNDRGLDMLNFFRVYCLFWSTFNHHVWSLISIPTGEVENYEFFRSFFLSFIKYSIYASELWVVLEAAVFGYKLMSYIKKYMNENKRKSHIPFCTLWKFYLNFLPKFFVFVAIFLFLHFFMKYYNLLFRFDSMYRYLLENLIHCRICLKDMSKLFIPFAIQYSSFIPISSQARGFDTCFKFVVVCLNMFYCNSLVMVIFYISSRIKNKIFDIMIFFIFILNTIFFFVSCKSYKGEYYSFDLFMGEACSLKYPHLFINLYLTGFFTGLSVFYYKDVTMRNSMATDIRIYKPFNFCYVFIAFLDKRGIVFKTCLLIFTILIQILMSTTYYFFKMIYGTYNNDNINVKIPEGLSLINFVDINEKKIVIFSFCLMILLILVFPKDTLFKSIYEINWFGSVSRVGFAYFCSMDTTIYIFYCLYHLELKLGYVNVLCVTIGLIIFIGLINILVVILIELPVRMIIKRINSCPLSIFESRTLSICEKEEK